MPLAVSRRRFAGSVLSINGKYTVYQPNTRAKSDADVMRDAKLEAMGMPPQDDSPRRSNHERTQMATDEIVRFHSLPDSNVVHKEFTRLWSDLKRGCANRPQFVTRTV